MIKSEFAEVRIAASNFFHFKNLGYEVKVGEIISVHVEHLNRGSKSKVIVECDYCHEEIEKQYSAYLISRNNSVINKDACSNCKHLKCKEANLLLYGVDNPMKIDWVVDKFKKTNMELYGVEFPSQNKDIANKISKSHLNATPEEIFESNKKREFTCIERYGVNHVSQNEQAKEKYRQTMILKYGVDNYFASEEFMERNIKHNLEKYGKARYQETEEFSKAMLIYWEELSEEFKNERSLKISNTRKEFSPDKKKSIRGKTEKTMMERYGKKNAFQLEGVRQKAFESLCKISKPQKDLFDMLKIHFAEIEINYIFSELCLDIFLVVDDVKIDIEYDSWYWHNPEKDFKRDKFVSSQGLKILRIKSGNKLPIIEDILEKINSLMDKNSDYAEIVLDDWNEEGYMST